MLSQSVHISTSRGRFNDLYIQLHKLLGSIAYVRDGWLWQLASEIAEMNFRAAVQSAFAATFIQSICSLFLVAGCPRKSLRDSD